MDDNKPFEDAVKEVYPIHYFLLDDFKRKQLLKMFKAGQRQGMERSAEIASKTIANPWHSAPTSCANASCAIRKEIT